MILNFTSSVKVPSAPIGATKSGASGGGVSDFKIRKIALIDVEQRVAIWARYAFGFVGSDQVDRPAAIRAAHSGG